MTDQQDFVADPKAFMDQHILIPMFPPPPQAGQRVFELIAEGGEIDVCVIQLPGSSVQNPPTPASKVFQFSMDHGNLGADSILKIHWLPYTADEFRVGILRSADRYMFTAAMNGCSLGFGSQVGDGGCLVTHANARTLGREQGLGAQRRQQRADIKTFFQDIEKFKVLEPHRYRVDGAGVGDWSACNFGISDGRKWRFWTSLYKRVGTSLAFTHGGPVTRAQTRVLAKH
jgi:hypothetical protein